MLRGNTINTKFLQTQSYISAKGVCITLNSNVLYASYEILILRLSIQGFNVQDWILRLVAYT